MCVETDADNFLLDGNHANSFLVQKRIMDYTCSEVQRHSELIRSSLTPRVDIYEECCDEGCDAEEFDEDIHPGGYSNSKRIRTNIYDFTIS